MKTLEEVIVTLDEEGKAAIQAAIAEKEAAVGTLTTERETFKRKYGETQTEKNRLLEKFKPLEGLESAIREAGLDPSDEHFADAIKAAKEAGGRSTEMERTVKSLQSQLKTLSEQKAEADRKAAEREQKIQRQSLKDRLMKSIGGQLVDGAADYVIDGLILRGNVKMSEDGETPVFIINSEEVSFDKGVEEWIKTNKSLIRNPQKSGGGSGSGGGGGKNTDEQPEMTLADWSKLPPKEQALFLLPKDKNGKGGKLIE